MFLIKCLILTNIELPDFSRLAVRILICDSLSGKITHYKANIYVNIIYINIYFTII